MIIISNFILTILCFAYLKNGIEVANIITYSNPLLILEAGSFFILFKNISFRSNVINLLARGSFMTYILHGYFLPCLSIEKIVNNNIMYVIIRMMGELYLRLCFGFCMLLQLEGYSII